MTDDELLRYSRHILLDELGIEGQERLLAAHAVVVGAGGLGSPVALYLASAGVGHTTLIDHDTVDATNLQRQIAHTLARVGQPKAESARVAMHAINPDVRIDALVQRADAALLDALLPDADVVLDCTDNFATRQLLNRACVQHRVPLVSGAAIRWSGQLAVYDSRQSDSPCYACIFAPDDAPEETRCATLGVFAPLVGVVGSLQAAEALKLLSGMGSALVGQLLTLDAQTLATRQLRLQRDPACPVCGAPA
jgi:molybdopterin-synthase adenylyltransferase